MTRKNIPFGFIFDYLIPLEVTVKSMFGLSAIYLDEKIMLILRQREDHTDANGVWIATYQENHKSLRNELPSLCPIPIYSSGVKETEWQILPADSIEFEDSVRKVCELIKNHDNRIGRIPKYRRRKTKIKGIINSKKP